MSPMTAATSALELFDGGSVELSSGELVASESLKIIQPSV